MIRRLLILGFVAALAVPLAACGRKGNPEEPENAVYPRVYPYTPIPGGTAPKERGGASDFQPPQPRVSAPPTNVKPPAAESGQNQ